MTTHLERSKNWIGERVAKPQQETRAEILAGREHASRATRALPGNARPFEFPGIVTRNVVEGGERGAQDRFKTFLSLFLTVAGLGLVATFAPMYPAFTIPCAVLAFIAGMNNANIFVAAGMTVAAVALTGLFFAPAAGMVGALATYAMISAGLATLGGWVIGRFWRASRS